MLNRRALLGAGLLAGVPVGASACTAASPPPRGFDPADWASVRSQFALDPAYGQFAAFVLAPAPAQVREAIRTHRDALDADPDYTPPGGASPTRPYARPPPATWARSRARSR
ncbi:hypothetical protein ACFQ0B_35365 [Nonomuraea thailandensis]